MDKNNQSCTPMTTIPVERELLERVVRPWNPGDSLEIQLAKDKDLADDALTSGE